VKISVKDKLGTLGRTNNSFLQSYITHCRETSLHLGTDADQCQDKSTIYVTHNSSLHHPCSFILKYATYQKGHSQHALPKFRITEKIVLNFLHLHVSQRPELLKDHQAMVSITAIT